MKPKISSMSLITLLLLVMGDRIATGQTPIGTTFNYQGKLDDQGISASGMFDFRFVLYDAEIGGNQVGSAIPSTGALTLKLNRGVFDVELDFGDGIFEGDARWLEVAVNHAGMSPLFILSPRYRLMPTPYSMLARKGIRGAGTPGRIPKFTGNKTIGDSVMHESAGKVGIGTTTPNETLSVAGSIESTSGGFKFPDGSIQTTAATGGTLWQASGLNIFYDTGNVGIGTNNPFEALDVVGNIHTSGTLSSGNSITIDGTNDVISSSSGAISFDDESLFTTGNLGIGTSNPTSELEVVGTVTTDGLTVNGTVAGTGFDDWDRDASDDLTDSTLFQGDVTGPHDATMVADDSHDHTDATVSDNLSINNTRLFAPAGAGNVGIGTTTPGATLEVAGQIKMTGGSPAAGRVLTSDAAGLASWQQAPSAELPSGMISYFNCDTCPDGWTEVIAGRGRYIVGIHPGGVLGMEIGIRLTNEENRPTGRHRHYHSLYRSNNVDTGKIVPGSGSIGTTALKGPVNRFVETGAFSEPPEGTNAPYIQFLLCQKD